MNAPLLAEAGLRLTYSIGLVGSLGFLGFSADPGAANWGQMIQENRLGLSTQPWAVMAPGDRHRCLRDRHQPDGRRHRPSSPAGRQLMTRRPETPSQTVPPGRPRRRGPRRRPDRQGRRRRRRHRPGAQARRGRRPGRRVGLRQDDGRHRRCSATRGRARSSRSGKVLFEGRDVLGMPWQEVRKLRGEEIAYVPQDPASALNPAIRIGKQIVELMAAAQHRHRGVAPAGRARRPGRGGPAQRRRVPQPLRPPALGRPGAAGRAGHGVPAEAQGAGARRADDRPRRDHAGAWCSRRWPSCAAPTASARSTSPTTSRWSPTSPTGWR